jgi:hypothetical protein
LTDDIEGMLALKNGRPSTLGDFPVPVTREFFLADIFRINSVNTKTYVLMLAQRRPVSFVSGQPVSLAAVLRDYNRSEFHHLYPRAFLSQMGVPPEVHGPLANFCFMSKADNVTLGGDAPSHYRTRMAANSDTILDRAVCPHSLFSDDYNRFLNDRAAMLERYAAELIT